MGGSADLKQLAWDVYGCDGGKKVKGQKRQTLVDSLGLLLKVVVSEANAPEKLLAAYALMELVEERPELLEKVEVLSIDSGDDSDKFALAVWLTLQVGFANRKNYVKLN